MASLFVTIVDVPKVRVVKTYPLDLHNDAWTMVDMFLRSTLRNKDGKAHRYFSVVENRRLTSGKVVQRTVLYLGEINDSQEAAWRKTLEVVDESAGRATELSLFAEDREIPPDAVNAIQVKLSEMELRRPRSFGDCWLGCQVWRELGLREFWQSRLPKGREGVAWEKVLQLLVVNRLASFDSRRAK